MIDGRIVAIERRSSTVCINKHVYLGLFTYIQWSLMAENHTQNDMIALKHKLITYLFQWQNVTEFSKHFLVLLNCS